MNEEQQRSQSRRRRFYDEEFKCNAVELLEAGGRSAVQLSREFRHFGLFFRQVEAQVWPGGAWWPEGLLPDQTTNHINKSPVRIFEARSNIEDEDKDEFEDDWLRLCRAAAFCAKFSSVPFSPHNLCCPVYGLALAAVVCYKAVNSLKMVPSIDPWAVVLCFAGAGVILLLIRVVRYFLRTKILRSARHGDRRPITDSFQGSYRRPLSCHQRKPFGQAPRLSVDCLQTRGLRFGWGR